MWLATASWLYITKINMLTKECKTLQMSTFKFSKVT